MFFYFYFVIDKSSKDISKFYLKKISLGLVFNEDVLYDRVFYILFYREDELNVLFRIGGLSYVKGNIVGVVGRYDLRGVVRKYVLCYLKGFRKFKFLRRLKIILVLCVIDKGKFILVIFNVKGLLSFIDKLVLK